MATKISRQQAYRFAKLCMECDSLTEAAAAARRLAKRCPGKAVKNGWKVLLRRFADRIESDSLPHSIFATEGNRKLPFVAFSTLPIVTCPGAGACAGIDKAGGKPSLRKAWCYSLRAWRYPAAFLRQCQNTLLLRFRRRDVIEAFKVLPQGITLRLYVDGDFDSAETAVFWFNLLQQRQDVACYGYSKSWKILESLSHMAPPNYVLNLSSGGIDDSPENRERMRGLPMTRGDFLAVPIQGKFAKGFARYTDPAYHKAVREAAAAAGIGKVFSCPGICDGCTGAGHACGAQTSEGLPIVTIPIAIGIH